MISTLLAIVNIHSIWVRSHCELALSSMSITPSEIKRLCRIDSDEICSCVSLWLLSHGMRSIADVTAAALDGRIDSLEGELFSQTLSAASMTSHV